MTFLVFCHPEILLPWQRDLTTSPLSNGTNSIPKTVPWCNSSPTQSRRKLVKFWAVLIQHGMNKTLEICHMLRSFIHPASKALRFPAYQGDAYAPKKYRAFSHDVTAALLVFQNNKTAAMLVFQTNPLGVKRFLLFQ